MNATFSLAKSIHYIHYSIQYMEDVIRQEQLTGDAKYFVNGLINKQKSVLRDLYSRMSSTGAALLRQELDARDIGTIDSILNMVITMDEETRLRAEEMISELCN